MRRRRRARPASEFVSETARSAYASERLVDPTYPPKPTLWVRGGPGGKRGGEFEARGRTRRSHAAIVVPRRHPRSEPGRNGARARAQSSSS